MDVTHNLESRSSAYLQERDRKGKRKVTFSYPLPESSTSGASTSKAAASASDVVPPQARKWNRTPLLVTQPKAVGSTAYDAKFAKLQSANDSLVYDHLIPELSRISENLEMNKGALKRDTQPSRRPREYDIGSNKFSLGLTTEKLLREVEEDTPVEGKDSQAVVEPETERSEIEARVRSGQTSTSSRIDLESKREALDKFFRDRGKAAEEEKEGPSQQSEEENFKRRTRRWLRRRTRPPEAKKQKPQN